MPPPFTSMGPLTLHTYTLLLGLGVSASIGWAVMWYRRIHPGYAAAVIDACLAGLLMALLCGRALHVALHWSYFALHHTEIVRLNAGGLNWHGAVIGALAGLLLVVHVRRLDSRRLLDALSPAVGLLAFMAWWGCGTSHCAYGAEVQTLADYPGWLVWERGDIFNLIAPRFATQPLGMVWSGIVLLAVLLMLWRGWLAGQRLWMALLMLAAGMFILGFLRGDYHPVLDPLRIDQIFDLLMMLAAGLLLIFPSR